MKDAVRVWSVKHPAFYNGKVLAEVLPRGTYRFSQASGGFLATFVYNPSITRAYSEFAGSSVSYGSQGPGDYPDYYEEGKAILKDNGYDISVDPGIIEKLEAIYRKWEKSLPVTLPDIRPGDTIARLPGDGMNGSYQMMTAFEVKELTEQSGRPCLQHDEAAVLHVYPTHKFLIWSSFPEITGAGETGKLVRVEPEDLRWLKETGPPGFEKSLVQEGRRVYQLALEEMSQYEKQVITVNWKGPGKQEAPGDENPWLLGHVFI